MTHINPQSLQQPLMIRMAHMGGQTIPRRHLGPEIAGRPIRLFMSERGEHSFV
jgi:hypothetical protein